MMNNSNVKFDSLGIAPKLLEILHKNKFVTPTPIQEQSIPAALTGSDLMGIAQTGTGKTLAFGLPMIQRLAQENSKPDSKGIGLVVLPTRELALQVNETLKKIGGSIGLKTSILIGGESVGRQIASLKKNPHVVVGTPGRIIDLLDQKALNLASTRILVLDEADRMLDMGFAPQIKTILEKVPRVRQTMLFSATMAPEIVKIANSYMRTPLRIEVAPAGSAVKSVTQEIFFLERGQKLSLLKKLLGEYTGTVLVFSRTKYGAKKIARDVRNMGVTSTEIHSNRSLNQRLEALEGFKKGKYRVLVATDIAARGIDVTGIQLVINYDLPDQAEDYVHRIGRTGRGSDKGHAISFATHDQKRDVNIIERLIRKALPVAKLPALEKVESLTPRFEGAERSGRSNQRSSNPERSGRDTRSNSRPSGRPSGRPNSRPSGRTSGRPSERSNNRPENRTSGNGGYRSQRSDFKPRTPRGIQEPRTPRGEYSDNKPQSPRSSRYGTPKPGSRNQSNQSRPKRGGRRQSDYERGRKPAPQSLKKISQNTNGFFISRKPFNDDDY